MEFCLSYCKYMVTIENLFEHKNKQALVEYVYVIDKGFQINSACFEALNFYFYIWYSVTSNFDENIMN